MQEISRDSVLAELSFHIGKERGVRCADIVRAITWREPTEGDKRHVRHVIEDMRREGQHICGHPGTGYFIAANDTELNDTCNFLLNRAMTSLKQISSMKKVSLPDLHGQLRLNT